jgi:hypothetical protein
MKGKNKSDKKRRQFGGGQGDKHKAAGADKISSCITDSSFLRCVDATPQTPLACVRLVAKQRTAVSLGIPELLYVPYLARSLCLKREWQLRFHPALVFSKRNQQNRTHSITHTHKHSNTH